MLIIKAAIHKYKYILAQILQPIIHHLGMCQITFPDLIKKYDFWLILQSYRVPWFAPSVLIRCITLGFCVPNRDDKSMGNLQFETFYVGLLLLLSHSLTLFSSQEDRTKSDLLLCSFQGRREACLLPKRKDWKVLHCGINIKNTECKYSQTIVWFSSHPALGLQTCQTPKHF